MEKRNIFVAVVLLTMQVYRRFYDTQRVSVFSEKSRMNLSHYLIGLIHYPGAALAILCEAPLFAKAPGKFDLPVRKFQLIIVLCLSCRDHSEPVIKFTFT